MYQIRIPRWRLPLPSKHKKRALFIGMTLGIFLVAFLVGIIANLGELIIWDSIIQLSRATVILDAYGLRGTYHPYPSLYATMWELFPGVLIYKILWFVHDPLLLYNSLTFALYPLALFFSFFLLRRAGIGKATTILSMACLFSMIRFAGHSLFNTKDFPAAAAYFIVALCLWVLLRECNERGYTPWRLCAAGCIATVPFLLRVPLILPFALLLGTLLFIVTLCKPKWSLWKRLAVLMLPAVAGVMFMVIFYPPFWTFDFIKWLAPFTEFGKYGWEGGVSVFGLDVYSMGIPWWFTFSWIPVIVHPLTFASCLIGFCALISPRIIPQTIGHTFFLKGKTWNLSLVRWLWIVTLLSFAAVIIKDPTLYDEDRHLIFLYPLLFLLGSLGLNFLSDKAKYVLAITITIVSIFSYAQWGKYSYVYLSPLVPDRTPGQFMGDYWGVCFGEAVKALKGRVPDGTLIFSEIAHSAGLEDQRLHESLFYRDPDFPHYRFMGLDPNQYPDPDSLSEESFAILDYNRRKNTHRYLGNKRSPRLIWETMMPLGNDAACSIILFEAK